MSHVGNAQSQRLAIPQVPEPTLHDIEFARTSQRVYQLFTTRRLQAKAVRVGFGSIATGRGKLQVQPCPQCPVSDGRPEKGGLSLRAQAV